MIDSDKKYTILLIKVLCFQLKKDQQLRHQVNYIIDINLILFNSINSLV